nr:adhesive plaque matrix protein-like isoform X2 [Oncorhynchus nerka]
MKKKKTSPTTQRQSRKYDTNKEENNTRLSRIDCAVDKLRDSPLLLEPNDPVVGQAFTLSSSTNGTMEEESQDCVRVSDSSAEAMEELSITECRVVDQSLCTTDPPMRSLDNFEAEIYDHEGKGAYRFQCPSAGLFQCSITGLVFRMEGEGEVLYRTVHWDMRLLSQNGKRPAGPLFNIDCPQKSVCQLHLPHCQIHSEEDAQAYPPAEEDAQAYPPAEEDAQAYPPAEEDAQAYPPAEEDAQAYPPAEEDAQAYPPAEEDAQAYPPAEEDAQAYPPAEEDAQAYPPAEEDAQAYPPAEEDAKAYPPVEEDAQTAEFLDFQSYENYFPTFQLFLLTVVKEFDLLLKENGSTENQWERRVWLPAPVQVQPHGPVAPVPAASAQPHGPAVPIQLQAVPTLHQPAPQPAGPAQVQPHGPVAPVPAGPAQVQPHGPAAPTAVVRPSVRED